MTEETSTTSPLLQGIDLGEEIAVVPTDDVQTDGDWAPDDAMVQSIASIGQIMPVILVRDDDGFLTVSDGRRRLAAIRKLGWSDVKAIVCESDAEAERVKALLTLAGNLHRSNPLSEARAIEALGDEDLTRDVGGLQKGQQRARAKLLNLLPAYQRQLERGELSLSAAKKLARLPQEEQGRAYKHAKTLMVRHNEERQRPERTVPTAGEIDDGVRHVRAEMQPELPVPNLNAEPQAGPPHDPVQMAAACDALADYYADEHPYLSMDLQDVAQGLREV